MKRRAEVLSLPVNTKEWGTGGPVNYDALAAFRGLFPDAHFGAEPLERLDAGAVFGSVRSSFRRRTVVNGDTALQHLATLNRLRALNQGSSVTTTAVSLSPHIEVRVDVTSCYVSSSEDKHWFAYRVRITNAGLVAVKLLGRAWLFESEGGAATEVPRFDSLPCSLRTLCSGCAGTPVSARTRPGCVCRSSPGVVGHTPTLLAGEAFEYTSGAALTSASGRMSGSFQMVVW
jgi:ApaG protein